MPLVAPSLLAANFLRLEDECRMLNESEADWFHLDIMDGRFVPNISFGPMIVEPEKYSEAFKKAGADHLIVHIEACSNLQWNIDQIRSLGMRPGVAINPDTPVADLSDILPFVHHVCFMSVYPGYGGQKFIPQSIERIKQLRKMIDEKGLNVLIEIDGGVTLENASSIVAAGADVLIAGNTVFKSPDPKTTIAKLKAIRQFESQKRP